jgi:CRISPR/Cas system-associated endonuclease Cas3-HD
MERPSVIPKYYSHRRDALARLLCALIDEDKLNEKELNEYLAHKIETAETTTLNANLKLAENTLKGCCREILETFSTIKTNDSEK